MKISIQKQIAIFLSLLLGGCTVASNSYESTKLMADIPESTHIVKIVSNTGERFEYGCSGVSVGKGLFLTSAFCIGRSNWVIGRDGARYSASIVKQGDDYLAGPGTISPVDENYAILYSPEVFIEPVKNISSSGNVYWGGLQVCAPFFTNKYFWTRNYMKPTISPRKICGKIIRQLDKHVIVEWDEVEEFRGAWGAPVFNNDGTLVGIISYKVFDTITQSGVLPTKVFYNELQNL